MSIQFRIPALFAAGLACGLPATVQAEHLALVAGVNGVAVDWSLPIADKVQTRVRGAFIKLDLIREIDGIEYELKLNDPQLGVLMDWYPFRHGLRLSTGMMIGSFGFELDAKPTSQYLIGDNTYIGNLKLDGEVQFNRVAPFIGIGWGAGRKANGLSLAIDLGFLYVGRPALSVEASGSVRSPELTGNIEVDVLSLTPFLEDLELERQEVEETLEQIRFYPVANIGLSYTY
jgi:hypothetical protein